MNGEWQCTVSVIIPTYGRPDYLKRAVDSVLKQTLQDFEVIVVDDNNPGTDARKETERTMLQYQEQSNIIYLQHERNKNGSAARNTGIRRAKGKNLCFLDDDDEMLPRRLEVFVSTMDSLESSWGACYSNFIKIKRNNQKDTCGEKRTGYLYKEALMRSLYFCPGSNLFVRSELVRKIGGFDEDFKRNQDMEFLARLLEHCKLAYVNDTTLIIHYENKARGKINYKNMVDLDDFYLAKFKSRIDELPPADRRNVYQFFALERLRYSIKMHQVKDGLYNCIGNRVGVLLFIRYFFYMAYRYITKKSVGFKI